LVELPFEDLGEVFVKVERDGKEEAEVDDGEVDVDEEGLAADVGEGVVEENEEEGDGVKDLGLPLAIAELVPHFFLPFAVEVVDKQGAEK
jgi:hypothetical protein